MKEADFYKHENGVIKCMLCPKGCSIKEGETGACFARRNTNGKLMAESYGRITSVALDPIEKKPLRRYCAGAAVLSIGGYGCNLDCGFCQNHGISLSCSGRDFVMPDFFVATPEEVVKKARYLENYGNIGIAYTYNEPLIGYEFVLDCAEEIHSAGLKNILVTNGYINREPLEKLLPHIDAANIDLKSFGNEFYKTLGGGAEPVKETIALAAKSCHVEVTTLIIPGQNDSEEEIEKIACWLSEIDKDLPLHISRFTPRHKYSHYSPTKRETVLRLAEIAGGKLNYVYTGNL